MSRVAFLLVTCCMEPTRADILAQVIHNLRNEAPELKSTLTVFDNASIEPGISEQLRDAFDNVYRADRNVGFWSAIDWWLEQMSSNPPSYVYVIESDMIHYNFNRLWLAASHLDKNPEVGSVRLHEYSVANRALFNKDAPIPGARPTAWWSHTNHANRKPVSFFSESENGIWKTSFLTQLPALNRYETMLSTFRKLRAMPKFSELDFQRMYWDRYNVTGILDGGIYNNDLGGDVKQNAAIGSWTSPEKLKQMGYQTTRVASITPSDQYTVSRLT